MKLNTPIEVVFDDLNSMIDELGKLQKYNLGEGDDMILVDVCDVADILMRHVKAREAHGMRGRWINKPHIYGVAYCSECDFELHINDTPYCPNCGCRMESENE